MPPVVEMVPPAEMTAMPAMSVKMVPPVSPKAMMPVSVSVVKAMVSRRPAMKSMTGLGRLGHSHNRHTADDGSQQCQNLHS